MTVHNEVIQVGSAAPVLLSGVSKTGQSLWLQNDQDGGAGTVTLGGQSVIAGQGPKLRSGREVGIDLQRSSDLLYGICAAGDTAAVLVLRVEE